MLMKKVNLNSYNEELNKLTQNPSKSYSLPKIISTRSNKLNLTIYEFRV